MFHFGNAQCRFFKKHLRIGKTVAYVYVSEHVQRIRGVIFDLLAHLTDEGAQVLDLFAAICAPHGGEQAGIGHDAAGADHEAVQNVEFLAGEVHGLAAPGDAALDGIEANFADLDGRIFGAGRSLDAANGGADAGNQLARAEGLGDVVVCAQVERLHLFFFLVANRQHQDGQPGSEGANAAQRLHAANAGHVHIQQDGIEGSAAQQLERLLAARGLGHLDPLSVSFSGAMVGGTLGAQIQTGHVVLGVEADIDWAKIDGSANAIPTIGGTLPGGCLGAVGCAASLTTKITSVSTGRLRVGYALIIGSFTGPEAWRFWKPIRVFRRSVASHAPPHFSRRPVQAPVRG